MSRKKKISYMYDGDVALYEFGASHPMKPYRMRIAHSIIKQWGLDEEMDIVRPSLATGMPCILPPVCPSICGTPQAQPGQVWMNRSAL